MPPPRRARDGRHGGVRAVAQGLQSVNDRVIAARPGGQATARPPTASTARGFRPRTSSRRPVRKSHAVLGYRANHILTGSARTSRLWPADSLDVAAMLGEITEAGLRNDVAVGFQYLSFWLGGRGRGGHRLPDGGGRRHGRDLALAAAAADLAPRDPRRRQRQSAARHLVRDVLDEDTARIREEVGDDHRRPGGRRRRRRSSSASPERGLPRVPDPDRLRQGRLSRAPAKDGVATHGRIGARLGF